MKLPFGIEVEFSAYANHDLLQRKVGHTHRYKEHRQYLRDKEEFGKDFAKEQVKWRKAERARYKGEIRRFPKRADGWRRGRIEMNDMDRRLEKLRQLKPFGDIRNLFGRTMVAATVRSMAHANLSYKGFGVSMIIKGSTRKLKDGEYAVQKNSRLHYSL